MLHFFWVILILLCPILSIPTPASGQNSNSKISEVTFKNCQATTELCGNGVDEDCDGKDLDCPITDKDNDGYPSNQDCNDQEHFIYPGITISCSSATCSSGHKTCQTNSSFTACSCSPLCEAIGSGKCYYVDPESGNDSNNGSFQSRLKTLKRFGSYSVPGSAPANLISLAAGDVVYLFSGVFNSQINTYDKSRFLALRAVRGTASAPIVFKNYPGEIPVIKVPSPTEGLYLLQDNYLRIEGIIIDGAYQAGMMLAESDNIVIRNVIVRNVEGPDNDNMAGIYMVGSTNIDIGNSVIHDNYDRENPDTGGMKTENSRNIIIFNGGNYRIHHSAIYQTPSLSDSKGGACLALKHSQSLANSNFVVDHNTFKNCSFNAIGTGGFNGHFHHNLILDSEIGFRIKDHGGGPNFYNNLMEYNTLINTPPIEFNPSEAALVNKAFHNQTFRYNIVKDNRRYSPTGVATFMIDPYGPNTIYNQVTSNKYFISTNNCFYSTNDYSMFSYFADNRNSSTSQGGAYSFDEWQDLGFDQGSYETDPNLNSFFAPLKSQCLNKGYLAP